MPVIIVSGLTREGSDATARRLALGAVDCYCKWTMRGAGRRWRLAEMVRNAARCGCAAATPVMSAPVRKAAQPGHAADRHRLLDRRGGGAAGAALQLSPDCPPTMIVQHVDSRFAPAIARTLNAACPRK
jgi:two-component system chemotaxis response regulator CheB